MTVTNVPSAMQGLGLCKEGEPCGYHSKKVASKYAGTGEGGSISVSPSNETWGKTYIEEIATLIAAEKKAISYTTASAGEKLTVVLNLVNDYWESHADDLNKLLHAAWQTWTETASKVGKYGAGGWAASPQQLSQLVETVKVLHGEAGIKFDDVLRVGTASGIHTQQEVFALGLAGIAKSQLYIVDICLPPLKESEAIAKAGVGGTILGSVLSLHGFMDNTWQVVTAHFTESFLPTAEQYQSAQMTPEQALIIKKAFFQKAHDLLMPGGVFIQAIGTTSDARRLHSPWEIKDLLAEAGFASENVVIAPTTDPFDYRDGVYLPGNYFVVAIKESV